MIRHRRFTHFYHETSDLEPPVSFKLRTDAYLYVIHFLVTLNEKLSGNSHIQHAIERIKIQFENHVQSFTETTQELNRILDDVALPRGDRVKLRRLIDTITFNNYEQDPIIKFNNPIARRYESVMAITFLTNPTSKMLEAVKAMSDRILPILNRSEYLEAYPHLVSIYDLKIRKFLNSIRYRVKKSYGNFGALPHYFSMSEVILTLMLNRPSDLAHIMLIQNEFINIFRYIPYGVPVKNEPFGEFKSKLKAYWKVTDNYMDYFGSKGLGSLHHKKHRLFADNYLYQLPIYGDHQRGRNQVLPDTHPLALTKVMGVMLPGDEDQLPSCTYSHLPYCRVQMPMFSSPYVKDLIDNDCVYVSGPSGMTTIFLGLMEMIGDFATIEQKQHYLMAIVAYMVATGHHSIHEILMPAQDGLNLIPGYLVSVPDENNLAPPPNYYQFYELQHRIDPEFMSRRESAWDSILSYYSSQILNRNQYESGLALRH